MYVPRGGSTLGPGAQAPQNVGQPPPQIFWFQQQKYVFLKSRLFLYSGEITRISLCISNDEVTDQISALSKSCYRILLFVTLLPALFAVRCYA